MMSVNLTKPVRLRNDGGAQLQLERNTVVYGLEVTSGGVLTLSGALTVTGRITAIASVSLAAGSHTLRDDDGTPQNTRLYCATDANNTGSRFLICDAGASVLRAEIRANGGLANFSANNVNLSDERVKKDISPLSSWWDKLRALEIVEYRYKDQTHDDLNIGVIAQQVESVVPHLVDTDGFGTVPEGEEPLRAVYDTDIFYGAVRALQEAMARIESIEAQLNA